MPDVNLQYIMAVILIDGRLTFEASHSVERMREALVQQIEQRVRLIANPTSPEGDRSARIDVRLRDGRTLSEFTQYSPGSRQNPLNDAAVEAKARSLMEPVLGPQRMEQVVSCVRGSETLGSIRDLTSVLRAP